MSTDPRHPNVPPALPWFELPLVRATPVSLAGYGLLVDDPRDLKIEIVTWPALGWRPVDPGTGNQGGTVSGDFDVWWDFDVLYARDSAANEEFLIGWSRNPGEIRAGSGTLAEPTGRERALLWHASYYPDGGRIFFPANGGPFIVPLALPGDDVTPQDFAAFYVEPGHGLYVHPGVWHEAAVPLGDRAKFHKCQGRVHARISCNFPEEFGVFLSVPLQAPSP